MEHEKNRESRKVIELSHLYKSYFIGKEEVPILKDINLTIEKGEFVSIMGHSGAGKSTLMNILGCLDRPTKGSYKLTGEEVAKLSDDELAYTRNKKIGFVFQSFNLLPKLTALDNVILPMIYGHTPKSIRKDKAEAMLRSVGLGDRMNHVPSEMSGGQRQRVAIARALINDPAIIMADEPTGNLDSKSTKEVMEIFKRLYEQGKTIILVTHEEDVAQIASRHLFIADGQISLDSKGEGL